MALVASRAQFHRPPPPDTAATTAASIGQAT
jgi:hypothetical protein